jgi:DNA-binding MarR family transcriptional regulator
MLTAPPSEENFQTYGLSGGTFDLLAALRRVGEPHTLTPTQLQGEMMLSSGATTHRIDLLEKEGYVARQADPDDRRGTLVKLTAKGLELVDRVLETHVATEKRLLEGLTDRERATLAELLGKLAVLYNM